MNKRKNVFQAVTKCASCSTRFKTADDLLKHGLEKHSSTLYNWCSLCNRGINKTYPNNWNRHQELPSHKATFHEVSWNELQEEKSRKKSKVTSESVANSTSQSGGGVHELNENVSVLNENESTLNENLSILNENDPENLAQTSSDSSNPQLVTSSHTIPTDQQAPQIEDTAIFPNSYSGDEGWTNLRYGALLSQQPVICRAKFQIPKLPSWRQNSEVKRTLRRLIDGYPPDITEKYYPFPSADFSFFSSLYLEDPSCSRFINTTLKFLNDPSYGHNSLTMPKSMHEIMQFVPKIRNKQAVYPDFGFPLSLELSRDGKYSFFPLKSIIQTALCDPELSKYITADKLPSRLVDGRIKDFSNAPITATNPLTTLKMSLTYADLSKRRPTFVGDLVQSREGDSGIVTSLYYDEADSFFYADVQEVLPAAQVSTNTEGVVVVNRTSDNVHVQEYVVMANWVKKRINLNQLTSKPYSTKLRANTILINKQYATIDDKLIEKGWYGTVSDVTYMYGLNQDLNKLRYRLINQDEDSIKLKDVCTVILEISKDELLTFRTRGYMCDVCNLCFCQASLALREKFASIWAACAFRNSVPEQERYRLLIKMIKEGEKGFKLWDPIDKKWRWIIVAFLLYSGDMAEFTKGMTAFILQFFNFL